MNMVLKKKSQIQIRKNKTKSRSMITVTKNKIKSLKEELNQYMDPNGYLSWSAKKRMFIILGTNSPQKGLVSCPKCKIGMLIVIRSPSTKKRFIGCSNFHNGCNASTPLLQKAKLRVLKSKCKICMWPIIVFRYSKKQEWKKQCSNIKCKSRSAKS